MMPGECKGDCVEAPGPTYPDIPPAEQAEAFLAWKRGDPVDFWYSGGWFPLLDQHYVKRNLIIRRKPEPKLRPWKHDEVPLMAWIRIKDRSDSASDFITTIQSRSRNGLWLAGASTATGFDEALRDLEYSTDGGRSWSTCGVQE